MTNQEIAIKSEVVRVLNKVFSGHLPPSVELSAESPYPIWDSLKHVQIILELEDSFDIEISDLEAEQIQDFASTMEFLLHRLASR